jgi:hypothetical protein
VLLDQVTDRQMQAGQMLGAATMVAFFAAPMFRRQAKTIRLVVAGLYLASVLGFLVCFLL